MFQTPDWPSDQEGDDKPKHKVVTWNHVDVLESCAPGVSPTKVKNTQFPLNCNYTLGKILRPNFWILNCIHKSSLGAVFSRP